MRFRIIIDTDDANEPDALESDTPFTLNVYRDDDNGMPSEESLNIGRELSLIGNDISLLLDELRIAFASSAVTNSDDNPVPNTGEQWRAELQQDEARCDECEDPAAQFWPTLNPPVQLCDSCTHNARRSGWSPDA